MSCNFICISSIGHSHGKVAQKVHIDQVLVLHTKLGRDISAGCMKRMRKKRQEWLVLFGPIFYFQFLGNLYHEVIQDDNYS